MTRTNPKILRVMCVFLSTTFEQVGKALDEKCSDWRNPDHNPDCSTCNQVVEDFFGL